MFCHTKPNVTQTNFYKLHPKLHPYQHEVDRFNTRRLPYYRILNLARARGPPAARCSFAAAPCAVSATGRFRCARPPTP